MTIYADPAATYRAAISYRGASTVIGTGLPTDANESTDSRWWTVDGDHVYPPFPDLRFEFAFGIAPYDPAILWTPGIWTDVTSSVHVPAGCTISRGQSSEFDSPQPGTATFTLVDDARRFDPLNDASPYAGLLMPRTPCRITATYDGIDYPMFTGYVDGFPQHYDVADQVVMIPIQATDILSILAAQRWLPARPAIVDDATLGQLDAANRLSGTDPSFPQERSGTRVATILDLVGIPAGLRAIDDGQTVIIGGTPAADGVYAHLCDVVATEHGALYADGAGVIHYDARTYPAANPSALFMDAEGWAITYAALELDAYAMQDVRNEVTRGNGRFDPVCAKDVDSAARYGTIADERTDLLFAYPGDARDQAHYLLGLYATPRARIRTMTVKPSRWPRYLFPGILAWDLNERFVVTRTPAHTGSAFSQTVAVVHIEHTFTSTDWTTTYALRQPDTTPYARLDDATAATLDGSNILAY